LAIIFLSLFKSILWVLRRNEKDVVKLYDSALPIVLSALEDYADPNRDDNAMLNFGYWKGDLKNPVNAQRNLCSLVAELGEFHDAKIIADVGSGFSGPAKYWRLHFRNLLNIMSVNINYSQLSRSLLSEDKSLSNTRISNSSSIAYYAHNNDLPRRQTTLLTEHENVDRDPASSIRFLCENQGSFVNKTENNHEEDENKEYDNKKNNNLISLLNATATALPFVSDSVERVVALESAQHFKQLDCFLMEAKRILKKNGLMIIAIPIIGPNISSNHLFQLFKFGILYFSWASEHYSLQAIESKIMANGGLRIDKVIHVGHNIYEPLASYYIQNRSLLRQKVKNNVTGNMQKILFDIIEYLVYKSALEMKSLSEQGAIEYVLIRVSKL
jgi:ubiquinone/menaquinone biosynthesis C-methylase UbiE